MSREFSSRNPRFWKGLPYFRSIIIYPSQTNYNKIVFNILKTLKGIGRFNQKYIKANTDIY